HSEADGRLHRQDRPPPQGQGGGGHGGLSLDDSTGDAARRHTHPVDLLHAIKVGGRLPAHVAVIMDGNGRWARARGLPRFRGHSAGIKSVRDTIEGAIEAGVEVLTLFTFSQEHWSRPAAEVEALM